MRTDRLLAATLAAVLSGCGASTAPLVSGSNAGTFSPGARASQAAPAGNGRVEFSLSIPRHRRSHYISAATQSIVVLAGSKKLGTFDTTPTSKGCSVRNGDTLGTFQ